jgi:hypothetical protein
MHPLQLLW